jgi:hypothetical protein
VDIETAHAEEATPFSRWLAVLVGLAAIVAAFLATLEVDASKREERALIQANRLSIRIFEETATDGPLTTFVLESRQKSLVPAIEGTFRAQLSLEGGDLAQLQQALSEAAGAASTAIGAAVERMTAPPGAASGIDEHTGRLIRAALAELERLLAGEPPADPDRHPGVLEQNRQVELAERYGLRGNRAVFALSLLALAAVLLGLAGVIGDGATARTALFAAAVTLTASVGVGVWSLLG